MRCIIWHHSTLAAQVLPIGYLLSRLKCVLRGKYNRMMSLRLYKLKVFCVQSVSRGFPRIVNIGLFKV